MTDSIDLTKVSFHDARLVGALHDGSTIVLTIGYFDDDDVEMSRLATIDGINGIVRDGEQIAHFVMKTPDGEIFRLVLEGQEVTLIVF